ncbi:MAG: glutathione S-transferase family protein [Verrucomicrobiales bacterium]|nr:glutathione S-transferase family protein [Verrucomicrobiales bacterium]
MADLRLHQLPHSPFCFPISQALTALGIPFEEINVPNGNRAAIISLTQGKGYEVPVLEHQENIIFETSAESQEVARYVDRTFARGRLFPDRWEGWQSLMIPHLEGDVEGVTFRLTDIHYVPAIPDPVDRVMVVRHKERRFGRGCLEDWRRNRESLFATATERMRPFDRILEHTPFLVGDQPVYSDFLLHGILSNLTWQSFNPMPNLPRLVDWYSRLGQFRYG